MPGKETTAENEAAPESKAAAGSEAGAKDKSDGQQSTLAKDLSWFQENILVLQQGIRQTEKYLDDLPGIQIGRWNCCDNISTLSTAELVMGTCFEIQPWTSMSKKIHCSPFQS